MFYVLLTDGVSPRYGKLSRDVVIIKTLFEIET